MRLAKPPKLSVVFLKFVEKVLMFQSRASGWLWKWRGLVTKAGGKVQILLSMLDAAISFEASGIWKNGKRAFMVPSAEKSVESSEI